MSRILVIMLMISTYAFASDGEHAGTDIVQRTVNFVIFVGLIWYLVAEPVKNYFVSRSQSIADDLKRVQEKLNESITLKKDALAKISEAEKFAEELDQSSKKENKIINDKMMLQCDFDLEGLVKHQVSLIDFDQRNMVRSVVEDIVKETLEQSSDTFDKEAMANVLVKKVA
ncbi:MAG: F0F1 ATP synthase subunit B [Sulfurimonas sp.]